MARPRSRRPRWEAGGVDAVVMAVAVGSGPRTPEGDADARATADSELAAVVSIAEANDNVVLVRSADELVKAHEAGQTSLLLGFQNARILEGDVAALDEFLRCRSSCVCHDTHRTQRLCRTPRAPSSTENPGATSQMLNMVGLSDLGQAAIRRINELGAVVDVFATVETGHAAGGGSIRDTDHRQPLECQDAIGCGEEPVR